MAVFLDQDVVEAARVDGRPRARRMVAPLAVLAATLVGLGYLAAIDPNQPGHYPLCPTRALFGVDCPGCGLLRGTHDLATGNLSGAVDHNILLIVFVPLLMVLYARWAWGSWTGRRDGVTYRQFRRRNTTMVVGLVLVLVFGVVRNFVPYLGSGIG